MVVGAFLAGSVAGASASDASIKSVIKSYNARMIVAEGHAVTAIGEYKQSANPSGVEAALTNSIGLLGSLRSAIATQSAPSPRVKAGKAKVEHGLSAMIHAYQHLEKAFGEKQASPQKARAEVKQGLRVAKKGRKELREGARLLR